MKDARSRSVLDALGDAVVVADLDEQILYANPAAEALFGWRAAELVGKPIQVLVPARVRERHTTAFKKYVETRRSSLMGRPIRVPALRSDGSELDIELSLALSEDADGPVVIASMRDLRGRVDMERQLAQARHLRATALAAARMAERLDLDHVASTAVHALVEGFNAAFAHLWIHGGGVALELRARAGFAREPSSPDGSRIIPPYDIAALSALSEPLVRSRRGVDDRFDAAFLDREQIAATAIYPLAVADERCGTLVCVFRRPLEEETVEALGTFARIVSSSLKDVRLFQREQAALAARSASEAWLSTALSSIGDAVIAVDGEARVTFMNPVAEVLTCAAAKDALGEPLRDVLHLVHAETRAPVESPVAQAAREGIVTLSCPTLLIGKDGTERAIEHTAARIRRDRGEDLGVILVLRDVTERRRAEDRRAFVVAATDLLATSLDYETTLGTVAWLAVPRHADLCAIDLLEGERALRNVALIHTDPEVAELAREGRRDHPPSLSEQSVLWRVIKSGRAELHHDIAEGRGDAARDPDLSRAVSLGLQSFMLVPLNIRGRTIGLVTFASTKPGRRYTEADLSMAEEVAGRAALAVENARLFQEIERGRDQLTAILGGVADGITAQDREGHVVYANEAAARAVGCDSARELLMRSTAELDDLVELSDESGRPVPITALLPGLSILGRNARSVTMRVRIRATGAVSWVVVKGAPVFDDNGDVQLVINIARDITEQKRIRDAESFLAHASIVLAESLDHADTLTKLANLAVPRFAQYCAVHLADERGELRMMAMTHADPRKHEIAREVEARFPPSESDTRGPGRVIRTGEPELIAEITPARRARGMRSPEHAALIEQLGVASYICVPLTARGRTLGAIAFFTGPTEEAYDARDLDLATELGRRAGIAVDNARLYSETKEAVAARDEFLTIASHELKTPLTSMLLALQGIVRALRDGRPPLDPDRIIPKLNIADRQSQRLAHLVEQLLDISRITAGRIIPEIAEMDLAELCREVIDRHANDLRTAGCGIELQAGAPVRGKWDPSRIDQVFTNLLANAMKFGRNRPIHVAVFEGAGRAWITVRDHGIGIAPADQARIFQRFERAVSSQNYGGFGMGLWIARQLVELHGGTISVESRPDEGSTFTVELPLEAAVPSSRHQSA